MQSIVVEVKIRQVGNLSVKSMCTAIFLVLSETIQVDLKYIYDGRFFF